MKFAMRQNHPFVRYSLVFSLLFYVNILAVSCTSTASRETSQAKKTSSSNPAISKPLRVAVLPAQSAKHQQEKLQPLAKYLEQTLKRPINFRIAKNYTDAVDLIVQEEVDMAYLGAFTYIQANKRNPHIQPIAAPIDQDSGRPWYTSTIVADSTKNIKSLQDLKGKRFAFVSPSSTSGFLIPMDGLQTAGIEPTKDFTKVHYSDSHDKAVQDLVAGVVDAIANDKAVFLRNQKSGTFSTSRYKIIWESKPIPATPVVINTKKFSPEVIKQIQQALIDAPVGVANIHGTKTAGYTLVKDANFEETRQIYNRLKSTKVAEK
ncbi:phosphonate ABC transporter, periplasmic phosphonate-binding protein (plasmid) [Calothrix sp. NIES-4101]|nr:phosphonate ABC transporter, periplasmic phosphonate-binding protein [Calothrix sp. NIES-4101]